MTEIDIVELCHLLIPPKIEMDNQQRQQLNDLTISKANEEIRVIQEKTRSTEAPIKPHQLRKQTTHEAQEQQLADHLKSQSPLRIVVQDDEYKSV